MAINTLDAAVAGMIPGYRFAKFLSSALATGRAYDTMHSSGYPGAMVTPTPGVAGEALTSYAGQLPFANPSAGETRLARFQAQAMQAGTLMLCDRLWHNSGLVVTNTGAQTVNSVAFPARDFDGTSNGKGVVVALEALGTMGSGVPTITYNYTNSDGTANRGATNVITVAASSPIGTMYELGLQAGDLGVQSIQTITFSASFISGSVSLVAYRVIASLEIPTTGLSNAIDIITGGSPIIPDNTVPFLIFIPSTTTVGAVQGQVIYTQG